jgi:hypothetical protein
MVGLSKRQVRARLDEIVAFSGLEDALDRQVKFYSSGMSVRLGFSIMSHTDPAILIVDEALAVGDAVFRQKCLQRMRDVVSAGTTLLYVSHGLKSLQGLCRRALWISDGELLMDGATTDVLDAYRQGIAQSIIAEGGDVSVVNAKVVHTAPGRPVRTGEDVEIHVALLAAAAVDEVAMTVGVSQGEGEPILMHTESAQLRSGESSWQLVLRNVPLAGGRYRVWFGMSAGEGRTLLPWQPLCGLRIDGPQVERSPLGIARLAPVWADAAVGPLPAADEPRLSPPVRLDRTARSGQPHREVSIEPVGE